MKTTKRPTELTDDEAAAIIDAFDDAPEESYVRHDPPRRTPTLRTAHERLTRVRI